MAGWREDRAFAYLHGFASSPRSHKGLALARAFAAHGAALSLPDLNRPSFGRRTYGTALAALDALDAAEGEGRTWRLIGSSLGGYLAARWAELRPGRVDRLLLLCPGFDLATRWPAIVGADAVARWERDGWYPFPGPDGAPEPVSWELVADARRHPPFPEVPCPTRIVHGTRDEIVPVALSRDYAAARPHVELIELDDDHGLLASLPRIETEALRLLE